MTTSPQALTREQHLHWKLAEEAAEVIQEASKASIFGADETIRETHVTNRERLIGELNDLWALCEMLGLHQVDRTHIDAKKAKVEKWLAYADSIGMVRPLVKEPVPDPVREAVLRWWLGGP